MATWPPKPEIHISVSLKLWQIGWQFQRQIWGFRPCPVRRNWSQAIASTTDNRKQQYRRFGRQSCNFWQSIVVAIIWLIFCRARRHQKSRIWRCNFDAVCLWQNSRNVIISGLGPYRYFRLSVAVILTCQHYFLPIHGFTLQICRWNFKCTFHSFRDASVSVFGHYFRLSVIIWIA